MFAHLQGFPRLGLTRRQGRQARAQPLFGIAQADELSRHPLTLAAEARVVRGDQREPEVALLGLQRFVLLRLLRLALE